MRFLELLQSLRRLDAKALRLSFKQMLSALSFVHSRSVVHRDVKPDNFLCNLDDAVPCDSPELGFTVKLCDFGLAKSLDNHGPGLKGIAGTAPFMSPEMLKKEYYDSKTDVWSLGVCLFTLLFGVFPYGSSARDSQGMREAIRSGKQDVRFRCSSRALSSQSAIPFIRSLLARTPEFRPAASEALEHPWLSEELVDDEYVYDNVLASARRHGAFDARNDKLGSGVVRGIVDKAVLDGQRQRFPKSCWRVLTPFPTCRMRRQCPALALPGSEVSSTRVSSGSCLASPREASVDEVILPEMRFVEL
eukprot:SRR837773.8494.p1 GENE.SRR837773.8494~~SRR837773.8494.p1  ORF type:complete len:304 (-),score=45.71 SRR837773.8494:42-953(-)